jgi:hypothetical protein
MGNGEDMTTKALTYRLLPCRIEKIPESIFMMQGPHNFERQYKPQKQEWLTQWRPK